jgi:sugar lactone lactonase YvrE
VAFSPIGTIYAFDPANLTIQSFDEDGTLAFSLGGQGAGDGRFLEPSGMAIDPDGNIYVSDMQRGDVQKFSPDGAYVSTIGGPGMHLGPGVGVDRDGNIYAPSGTQVHKFSPHGDLLMTFGNDGTSEGQLGFASYIVVDDAGNIYVSDEQNNQIKVYDPSGAYVASIGSFGAEPGQFIEPGNLAWKDGLLYVEDYGNQRLQVFSVTIPSPQA